MFCSRRQRRVYAVFFLGFFILNGALQLALAGVSAGLTDRSRGAVPVMNSFSAGSTEKDSCACSCCGDVCSMGKRCCCNRETPPPLKPVGLFFASIGCHAGRDMATQTPALGFLEYRYLPPSQPAAIIAQCEVKPVFPFVHAPVSIDHEPEAPPPRHSV